MPDYTVSGDVDSMLRSANDAAIRSAIGVGQTDAPTFLAITLNDTPLVRDATGVLAQRNGTAKQVHRVYNTFLGTTADEWGGFDWLTTTNTLRIGTGHGGTGTARPIDFVTGGVAKWQISAAGHFLAATDALYDIGASGANRPKDIYAAGMISSGGYIRSSVGYRFLTGGSYFVESANGVLRITDSGLDGFGRLQLGGTTDAFPSIARDGAGIKITGAATGSTSWIKVPAVAVSALPSAATAGVGARSFVNDALTPVFGNAVAGSGLSKVPVYSDGTNWNVG